MSELQLTPEEQRAIVMKQLLIDMEKAKGVAQMIRERTIGAPFTLTKLAELTRSHPTEILKKVNDISKYGFVGVQDKHGIKYYNIILNPKERIESMHNLKTQLTNNCTIQCAYITQMQELIADEIEEAKIMPLETTPHQLETTI